MIKNFIQYLDLEKRYSRHTQDAYYRDLVSFKDFFRNEYSSSDIYLAHYNQIRSWIVFLSEHGNSNRTINRKISSLKGFYDYLIKIDHISCSPLKKHRSLKVQSKIQVPFSELEMEEVFEKPVEGFEGYRDYLIVFLLYATGFRRSELIGLLDVDVDVENKKIKVLGKRSKERIVPVGDKVCFFVERYRVERKKLFSGSDFFFLTNKGRKLYDSFVYRVVNSYISGVSSKVKISPHVLRHTFATHLLNNGADLNSVKELLGHSSLASTQIYTHNSMEQLKKVFNKAHPRSENS